MKKPAQLDLGENEYEIVRAILKQNLPDTEVRAFGSRVTGRARPYSDLDLVIMTQTSMPLSELAALREAFSESDLPWKVDLVDWASTSANFRAIINQDNVVIQGTGKHE